MPAALVRVRRLPARLSALVAVLVLTGTTAAGAATAKPPKHRPRTILNSPLLWATINACNPKDHPNTIGVRGSMPGDGQPKETMYMRFRVQYQDPTSKQWVFVTSGADSGFLPVGGGNFSARQSGRSFQIVPAAGQHYLLRGAVSFEWRRGNTEIRSARIHTTAPHRDAQGGDPKGYTTATCTI